jgi:hypothetical protein
MSTIEKPYVDENLNNLMDRGGRVKTGKFIFNRTTNQIIKSSRNDLPAQVPVLCPSEAIDRLSASFGIALNNPSENGP